MKVLQFSANTSFPSEPKNWIQNNEWFLYKIKLMWWEFLVFIPTVSYWISILIENFHHQSCARIDKWEIVLWATTNLINLKDWRMEVFYCFYTVTMMWDLGVQGANVDKWITCVICGGIAFIAILYSINGL